MAPPKPKVEPLPNAVSHSLSWATKDDADLLPGILRSLYRHDVPDAPEPTEDQITDHIHDLLSGATPHRLLLAKDQQGRIIGLAAIALFTSVSDPRLSHRRQIELKELYVLPECRGEGVGEALFHWIKTHAKSVGAHRIDWHVKRDNARGIGFYHRQDAQIVQTRLSMRLILD